MSILNVYMFHRINIFIFLLFFSLHHKFIYNVPTCPSCVLLLTLESLHKNQNVSLTTARCHTRSFLIKICKYFHKIILPVFKEKLLCKSTNTRFCVMLNSPF